MGVSKNWSNFAPNMEEKHLYIISGQKQETDIRNSVTFKKIEAYVKHWAQANDR